MSNNVRPQKHTEVVFKAQNFLQKFPDNSDSHADSNADSNAG